MLWNEVELCKKSAGFSSKLRHNFLLQSSSIRVTLEPKSIFSSLFYASQCYVRVSQSWQLFCHLKHTSIPRPKVGLSRLLQSELPYVHIVSSSYIQTSLSSKLFVRSSFVQMCACPDFCAFTPILISIFIVLTEASHNLLFFLHRYFEVMVRVYGFNGQYIYIKNMVNKLSGWNWWN